jgi:hypothetical protein
LVLIDLLMVYLPILSRLSFYFAMPVFSALSLSFSNTKVISRPLKISLWILLFTLMCYEFYKNCTNSDNFLIPYTFFWEKS